MGQILPRLFFTKNLKTEVTQLVHFDLFFLYKPKYFDFFVQKKLHKKHAQIAHPISPPPSSNTRTNKTTTKQQEKISEK